jgi:hypothetical protein
VDRITRKGRAAYAPKRCLNTLLNIERETFFGKPNNVLCYTLINGYINILCGAENNTRLQTTYTILDQYERKSINSHKLKSSSYCLRPILIKFMGPFSLIIFFNFLNEMQTSPFNIFEISKMRRVP